MEDQDKARIKAEAEKMVADLLKEDTIVNRIFNIGKRIIIFILCLLSIPFVAFVTGLILGALWFAFRKGFIFPSNYPNG